jgi:hypothetical protein
MEQLQVAQAQEHIVDQVEVHLEVLCTMIKLLMVVYTLEKAVMALVFQEDQVEAL